MVEGINNNKHIRLWNRKGGGIYAVPKTKGIVHYQATEQRRKYWGTHKKKYIYIFTENEKLQRKLVAAKSRNTY